METTKPCGTCGLATPDGTCPDCSGETRTYHVEFSPATRTYSVIEFSEGGDLSLVVASGLSLSEALRRRKHYQTA